MDFTGEIESASWIFNTIVARERIPVSEHLFAWRTTTTARLTDDAEAMGNDLDPVLCTVGPATAHRRPHAIQLLGRLLPRTFRRQRARRSGSVRPSCSHSGNESRMGSACPAPWQRWLDQV